MYLGTAFTPYAMLSPKPPRLTPQTHYIVRTGLHKGLRVVTLSEQQDGVWACCPTELPTRTLFIPGHQLDHE